MASSPVVVVVVAVYYSNIVIDSGYHCRLQLSLGGVKWVIIFVGALCGTVYHFTRIEKQKNKTTENAKKREKKTRGFLERRSFVP